MMLCRGLSTASRSARRITGTVARRFAQTSSQEYKYHGHGSPERVLQLESTQLPSLKPNDVLIKMLASPINPADLNMVQGVYPIQPTLPATGGNEGVAKVIQVGSSVADLKVDDLVIPSDAGFGTWRTHAVAGEAELLKVPSSIEQPEHAACLSVNPCTAFRLLNDFKKLSKGDVIIQNAANSAVGQSVFQMARAKGVTSINIIRKNPNHDRLVERMKSNGADIVVTEDYIQTPEFQRLISDLPAPKLALNGVGGHSATDMARVLGQGGTMVTYGGMSRKPIQLPTSLFIFKQIELKGFWMSQWNKEASKADRQSMLEEVANMLTTGSLRFWVENFKFSQFQQALKKSQEPYTSRKVLLIHD